MLPSSLFFLSFLKIILLPFRRWSQMPEQESIWIIRSAITHLQIPNRKAQLAAQIVKKVGILELDHNSHGWR